jgi:uncharacterized membrane-anchored protein
VRERDGAGGGRRDRAPHALIALLLLGALAAPAAAQEPGPAGATPSAFDTIPWIRGPARGALRGVAEVRVPEGFLFVGEDEVERLMDLMENPATGDEVGFLAPAGFLAEEPGSGNWYLLFEFVELGHVEAGDGWDLDEKTVLEGLRESNAAASEERRRRGWEPLDLVDWEEPPRFDPATHTLAWALRFREPGGQFLRNFFVCRLGRRGVLSVTLGGAPGVARAAAPRMRELVAGLAFLPGHDHGDFRPGDEVFEPGLAGLILGRRPSGIPGFLARWRLVLMTLLLIASLSAALLWWRRKGRG